MKPVGNYYNVISHLTSPPGAFAFAGYYHRHSESTYVGPHGEQFQTRDLSQGLYCQSDDSDAQCIYKCV